jgi:hypothetical protein
MWLTVQINAYFIYKKNIIDCGEECVDEAMFGVDGIIWTCLCRFPTLYSVIIL